VVGEHPRRADHPHVVIVLGIPDIFQYMDSTLQREISERLEQKL